MIDFVHQVIEFVNEIGFKSNVVLEDNAGSQLPIDNLNANQLINKQSKILKMKYNKLPPAKWRSD